MKTHSGCLRACCQAWNAPDQLSVHSRDTLRLRTKRFGGGLKMTQRVERRWRKTSKHWRSVRLAGPGGKHSLWSLVRKKIKPPGGSASSVARENYIRDSRKANWIRCSETSKNGGSQRSAGQVKNPGRQLSSIARSESGEGLVSSSATDERLAGSS